MEKELKQRACGLIKIVLYGPESTGKTTLTKLLADYYKTQWVPEFSREYLQAKWDREHKICDLEDILPIAKGQMALENELAEKANGVLFCDTNLLETVVYSKAYFDKYCDPSVLKHALKAHYDLYFLTYIDVPWVEDDLRDRPHQRESMFAKFKEPLDFYNIPYVILKGTLEERLHTAIKKIEELKKSNKLGFSSKDLSQIEEKGLKPEEVEQQIAIFKRGNVVVNVREAATLKNGINSFSEQEKLQLINLYDAQRNDLDILKFVPASGAATRMFKSFYNFLNEYDAGRETVEEYIERTSNSQLEMFFGRMSNLPFFNDLVAKARENNPHFDDLPQDEQQVLLVRIMLSPEGLDLGDMPKGLVPFHKYEDHLATAFEEHLVESEDYMVSKNRVKVHFTVSEEHRQKFEEEYRRIKPRLERGGGVAFDISYSYQDAKTDTIAVDSSNEPFRDENGKLFFRPGGHGALIGNLNERNEDLVFIKNIDNVVTPRYRSIVADHKKMLAGKLLELQEKTFNCLRRLEERELPEEEVDQMIVFLKEELNSGLSIEFSDLKRSEIISALKRKFNRPIRVCGMVKNEGEPGGGPFWVTHQTGEISLQIVESSQIDHDNYQQSKIASEATHFNPVDIVCGLKNYKGKAFDLHQFVDQSTSFIANKTKDGKELKALELPGLWNGAMADWITIFVEVPVETFNPVKTVADLLKPSHQVR